ATRLLRQRHAAPGDLPSFPTRRSSDLYRDRGTKRGRGRSADAYDDLEVTEDDVLVPVAGILDLHDSYAFVRTTGYLPGPSDVYRSEEHTSELQSRENLVCRLLLEKKKR